MNPNELYAGMPAENWYAIHGVALFVIFTSVIGSILIIYLTLKKMRKARLHLLQKFPMYISFCDLLFGFFHGLDHISSMVEGRVAYGAYCKFLGFGTVFSMNIPSFCVSACSLCIYQTLVRKSKLDFGPYDWQLLLACYALPFVIGLIPFQWDGYANEGAWCGLPYGRDLLYFNSLFIFGALLLNMIIYSLTYISLKKMAGDKKKHREGVQEFAKQLPIFVAIFIVQWIPYAIYAIMFEVKTFIYQYNVFTVIMVNSGGFLNALAYGNLIRSAKSNHDSALKTSKAASKNDAPSNPHVDFSSIHPPTRILANDASEFHEQGGGGPSELPVSEVDQNIKRAFTRTQMVNEVGTELITNDDAPAALKHIVSHRK